MAAILSRPQCVKAGYKIVPVENGIQVNINFGVANQADINVSSQDVYLEKPVK